MARGGATGRAAADGGGPKSVPPERLLGRRRRLRRLSRLRVPGMSSTLPLSALSVLLPRESPHPGGGTRESPHSGPSVRSRERSCGSTEAAGEWRCPALPGLESPVRESRGPDSVSFGRLLQVPTPTRPYMYRGATASLTAHTRPYYTAARRLIFSSERSSKKSAFLDRGGGLCTHAVCCPPRTGAS
jgi:hypothetical protein